MNRFSSCLLVVALLVSSMAVNADSLELPRQKGKGKSSTDKRIKKQKKRQKKNPGDCPRIDC